MWFLHVSILLILIVLSAASEEHGTKALLLTMEQKFADFNEQVIASRCPSTLRGQQKVHPYETKVTRCELDSLESEVPISSDHSVAPSSILEHGGVVFMANPSPRGISNQFMFNGGFFEWATEHKVVILPPVFHMDGYNITNDYVMPFSFFFDRKSLYEAAHTRSLHVTTHEIVEQATFDGRSTHVYGLGRKCMTLERMCTGIRNITSPSSPRIIKALHWKYPSWTWITMPFSRRIDNVVLPIAQFLRRDGCFASFHFRVEIDSSDRERWAAGANFGSLDDHISNAAKILEGYRKDGKCALYVASYLPSDHFAFKKLQSAIPYWRIFTKFDFFPATIENYKTMTRNMMAIIEMAVLEKADWFLGNCRSSFSASIAKRRGDTTHPVEWVIPCANTG